MKNIISAFALIAVLGTAAMAQAATPASSAAPAAQSAMVKLTKKQEHEIYSACKKENPSDKKAYNTCVDAKKKAAETPATTPETK